MQSIVIQQGHQRFNYMNLSNNFFVASTPSCGDIGQDLIKYAMVKGSGTHESSCIGGECL